MTAVESLQIGALFILAVVCIAIVVAVAVVSQ
jgi:hypothetical protein